MRPNKTVTSLGPPSDAVLRFIGVIATPWTNRDDCPRQGRPDGRIVKYPVLHATLKGIEDYDTIEVLYWLDQSRRDLIFQSPRSDGSKIATFALRSPVRPNPIGTALVRRLRIEDRTLAVRGLDETLLIDIRPDRRAFPPKA